ncbi:ABC transporter permease [Microbispora sp. NPDC049125]|uniref:ABC transporter permease n=1 Tax=Microbispora sp. NPDC049125 TaxID=3154929 RepID=UPI003466FB88
MRTGYVVFEIRRAFRDSKFFLFAVALPVGLFVLESNVIRDVPASYLMGSLAAFGAFKAALDTGARTAVERGIGWQRQLRLTPLTGAGYLTAKAAVAMLVALPPVAGVSLAAALLSGVELTTPAKLATLLAIWAGIVPFALLGLLIGQLATPQNLQAYQGGVVLVMSFVGGLFIPVTSFPAVLARIAEVLPSYWLAEIGHSVAPGGGRIGQAALVLALYTLALGVAVAVRYRRDQARP